VLFGLRPDRPGHRALLAEAARVHATYKVDSAWKRPP
jgi:hypothetical protein